MEHKELKSFYLSLFPDQPYNENVDSVLDIAIHDILNHDVFPYKEDPRILVWCVNFYISGFREGWTAALKFI